MMMTSLVLLKRYHFKFNSILLSYLLCSLDVGSIRYFVYFAQLRLRLHTSRSFAV